MRPQTVNDAYLELLQEVYYNGERMVNARTGSGIVALHGGHSFKLELSDRRLPVPGNRRYYPAIAAAEVAWQFLGTKDPTFILSKAPKLWSKFVQEDGTIPAAYGYRWRTHFKRDQLGLAVHRLREDPSCRQVYVGTWDPAVDGLGQPGQPKNIPCITGLSLSVVDRRLHASVFLRSSDVAVGLPYDIMSYALMLDAMASSVTTSANRVEPGTLHFTLAHAHYYDAQSDIVLRAMHDGWLKTVGPRMPSFYGVDCRWNMNTIVTDPDGYLAHMTSACREDVYQWTRNDNDIKTEVVA